MNQSPTVLKFGGTSVEDARAFERVARIVLAQADASPVVVVSAMSRVTDALLASFKRAAEEGKAEEAARSLEEHFDRHRAAARELLSAEDAAAFEAALSKARCELAALLQAAATQVGDRPALQDEVLSYGERLSADLLAGVVRGIGPQPARCVDARRCLVTDGQFGRAEPEMKETTRATRSVVVPIMEAGEIPVLGGFIAATADGMTTTLGRGGSDYTAAIVGAALAAREIQIWTDVSGVLTADPRVVAGARSIPRLSYAEAAELAYFGAKVLHPKTILPAVVRGIPVRICNSRAPESESTVINFDTDATPHTVKAIAHKKNVTIIHVTSARMLGAYGFLRALFEVFDRHRTVVDLVTTSEVSVSLSLEGAHALDEIVADLGRIGAVKVEHGRALICVVGEGLRDARGVAAKIFTAVRDINVMLISQGASSINLTFVVDESHAERAVCRLHEAFFEKNTRELYQTAAADD
jgi:aspartate kinase